MPYIKIFLIIFGLVSCDNQKLRREYEEFISKEIVVPVGMRQMAEGRDSVVLNPAVGAARLIMWVDSMSCSSCQINQMFQYGEVVEYRGETGNVFSPVFVFSPSREKIEEVIRTFRLVQFDYPVFLDEGQAFPAANPHIPADKMFHTFLIDKNGKVVLVGDPANNPQLWDLYKSTITTLIENGGTMPEVEK